MNSLEPLYHMRMKIRIDSEWWLKSEVLTTIQLDVIKEVWDANDTMGIKQMVYQELRYG